MTAFLKTAGRWSGILTIIILVITLLRQLISLVGFLLVAFKVIIVVAFVGLILLMTVLVLRGRSQRRREAEEI